MFGEPLLHLEVTGSTNQVALDWTEAPHGAAVVADRQTAGRGRLGRSWNSPGGKGLYLSLVLRTSEAPQLPRLSLLAALAAARGLERAGAPKVQCKWPNDLLIQQPNGHRVKIGGILCESRMGEQGRRTVIGIGINLNHTAEDLPERPQFPASSLLMLTEREWPVKEILPLILAELESAVEALERGEWGQLLDSFNQRCAGIGDVVQVQNGEDRILGVLQEVDPEGRLVIRTADGPKTVVVGDVSYL
jgi:BirA family biotin operon repressor/biotin-[acetyl-CoA-carboxylase] ligase